MPCDWAEITDADVILRSADGREFPAHKSTLSIASSVFRNMFSFPQPPSSEPLSTPVVDVCESGKVIDAFLRCIYPVSKHTINDLELLEALIAAADKYEAEIILSTVQTWLTDPGNLRQDPLRVYAIACSSPFPWEVQRAAARCMTFNMVASGDAGTIARLTMATYPRLITYLVQREQNTKIAIDIPSWEISRDSQCVCNSENILEMKDAIKKAMTDEYMSNPSLSEEGSVVVAFKQLSKVRACLLGENCSLVTQGEKFAKELHWTLGEMSDEMWGDTYL
ncbi:hypothetical protein BJ322DRAFT_230353 [Thelephora terrestris]|uniref:BTB domain-containing protein n=1 Tax=Thelephora terrestris TaxID=56493 RepID=A0A9P6H859_9AGAM|nr:hypothetical protein BJ322DRAFT_230353 [Thelephora terrestris]